MKFLIVLAASILLSIQALALNENKYLPKIKMGAQSSSSAVAYKSMLDAKIKASNKDSAKKDQAYRQVKTFFDTHCTDKPVECTKPDISFQSQTNACATAMLNAQALVDEILEGKPAKYASMDINEGCRPKGAAKAKPTAPPKGAANDALAHPENNPKKYVNPKKK